MTSLLEKRIQLATGSVISYEMRCINGNDGG